MKPRTYKSEGIVLARRDYSEADRIISVFSKGWGRISLLAKSVRKPKSRKRPHIEVFSQISFQAARGKGIDIITEVDVIDNYLIVRKDLKKVALAYYFMEVVGRITGEEETNISVFNTLVKYLNLLKKERRLKELRLSFIRELLDNLGFWPKTKKLLNPDEKLSEILERNLSSMRVGKKLLA